MLVLDVYSRAPESMFIASWKLPLDSLLCSGVFRLGSANSDSLVSDSLSVCSSASLCQALRKPYYLKAQTAYYRTLGLVISYNGTSLPAAIVKAKLAFVSFSS